MRDQRRYNLPRAYEVAAVFFGDNGEVPKYRHVAVHSRGQNRLAFHRQNQKILRVELYKGLMDHLASEAAIQGSKLRRIIILPSSFQGSSRAMQQNYQDAMGIVQKCGKPGLFITFTCNPRWKEIEEQLFPGQTSSDRPDLIARVFRLKLKQFIDDIGHDCANIKLELPVKDGATFAKTLEWDEIKAHLDARYASVPEAVWRLFEFPLHDKSHSIIRLAIHLPNMQPVYFAEGNELEALNRATEKDTTLIAWFKLNRDNLVARRYLYHDIPNHFVFDRENKWKRRQQGGKVISRIIPDFDIPIPSMFCPLQSKNINKEEELRFGQEMYETLNEAQRSAVDKILGAYHRRSATTAPCFFIDVPGGTGKTYLYNTLCYLFKGQGVSGLTVAWTGIAANLLAEGRTVHSRFKLPVPLLQTSKSSIRSNTKKADTIRKADVVIWDEALMVRSYALKAVDILLRDIMNINVPFGNDAMIVSSEYQQLKIAWNNIAVGFYGTSNVSAIYTSPTFNATNVVIHTF
ncbi:unnamed protein product [Rotaria socialis]|uniref:ATP-dependent DNA helicase n=1 Tax=Rotaria socialis TaxID=392032 RepID=A0A820UD22_9BILA|nr:unnamed protein product [Rotaria socialis]